MKFIRISSLCCLRTFQILLEFFISPLLLSSQLTGFPFILVFVITLTLLLVIFVCQLRHSVTK